ncbi:hypothetical protein J1614_003360 [Plenodomus biglobosus]|nr:hypothetical protein J1614_003360 [Plenodomus biglobosus]
MGLDTPQTPPTSYVAVGQRDRPTQRMKAALAIASSKPSFSGVPRDSVSGSAYSKSGNYHRLSSHRAEYGNSLT